MKWKVNSAVQKVNTRRKNLSMLNKRHLSENGREWINRTDEEHLKNQEMFAECKMCGGNVPAWIECEFSFCDEYECGMEICKDCAKKIYEKSLEIKE